MEGTGAEGISEEGLSALAGAVVRVAWRRESPNGYSILALESASGSAIAKVARTPLGEGRLRRNAEALEWFRFSGAIPSTFGDLIPRLLALRSVAGCLATLETRLSGETPGHDAPGLVRRNALRAAARSLTALHACVARPVEISGSHWAERYEPDLAAVGRLASEIRVGKQFAHLRTSLEDALRGITLPHVPAHGDCWLGNILFAPIPIVSGIINWALFEEECPALMDLYHLCLREVSADNHVETGGAVLMLDRALGSGAGIDVASEYSERLGIDRKHWRPLLRSHWVREIARQLRADADALRRADWRRDNVQAVILGLEPLAPKPIHVGAADTGAPRSSAPRREDSLKSLDRKLQHAYEQESAIFDQRKYRNPGQVLGARLQDELLRTVLAPAPGTRLLDVATGTGQGALAFASLPVMVMGCDLADGMLQRLMEKMTRNQCSNISLQRASARALPYRNAAFGRVISLRFLYLIPPALQPLIVAEMARVLAPSGLLAVSLRNPWHAMGKGFRRMLWAKLTGRRTNAGYLWPWQERALFRSFQTRRRFGLGPPGLALLNRIHPSAARTYGRWSARLPLSILCSSTLHVCVKAAPRS